ncbi:bifunctional heparan sulfate N-deacetylase/N-sulfotransferase [Zeugodacus cucurbitae]|uniref:[heparan sulfate]-glucosamine N-sulfotransferase n=1 Tax=Zeugodacus cucurbitae TaxID=28588 RepID=A0A0A1XBX4_ZEUCU|nr:bifunctional heparan sulfate N-deacetylase/N-sulfotransferase [Zeugodacus cucurbitae]XP_054084596.1 bifunctional heparan sulfate N-deacetylase/N-sulfotransferase [Zeugodacus cucurbitae]XP_054084597.1 bifunctional heparan sulfate N-deacetylase/N-sulfotransferase [Zeugodacus cucurbitae]XP_054084598.1 bifunctional heparan sulfate N-deacetylase/N-sulfotransferase [Zeugodacus cucurbitae]XP_054084599.1 bifunctional heparan sulfate N-deacetylase/N-sulfotransferase [Zeugodacus cucurbitae]
MTISNLNRLNRRRNINNNSGDNNNTADTELLLVGAISAKTTQNSASANGGRIKRLRRPAAAVKMTTLNQQATDDMTTTRTTTRELNTDSSTMNGNSTGNSSARVSKFLPGKSLKYERLINQPQNAGTTPPATAKTITKAIDGITSEAALNTNGNEWPPQQHWRLQDEATATAAMSSWRDAHSSSTPATATSATEAAAAMKNWQAHSEGAEMHLSPAVNGLDVQNANAKAPVKVRSRRANANGNGNGGNSWSGNYQQQHPHTPQPQPQPTATTPTTTKPAQPVRTQSQTVNNGGGFGNMTGNGNSYGSSNNVKYFGNGVDCNGTSASDTVALLSALPTDGVGTASSAYDQQQPTTNRHSQSANLTRSSKGFYYTSIDNGADFDAAYTSQAPSASESSPLYYSSAASSARSASSPAAFYTSNGASASSPSRSGSGSGSSAAVALACNCCSNLIARCCIGIPLLKAINVRRCVLALFAITVVTIFYYTHYVDTGVFVGLIQRDTRPSPLINCRMVSGKHTRESSRAPDHRSEARLRIDPKVLVFVETTYSGLGRDIAELLVYNRIKYKIEVAGKSLPVLTNLDKGRYGVIVFENLDKYLNMDKWNRELLDKYCREYSVGIVGFVSPSEETLVAAQLRGFPLYIHTNLRLRDASLNPASPVLRLTRAGETAWGALPGDDWAVFQHNHTTYEPVEWAQRNTQDYPTDNGGQVQLPLTTVLQDHGHFDGIQRVFFGSNLRFWLHRLLFLDALSYLSHGQLSLSLERMILVDIDDIFVGERGTRLRPDDVQALIATQRIIASMVPGFRFNLGFSGKFYHHGEREENLGDDYLLRNVQEFNWFSHMWKHQQPHLYDNLTLLMSEMQLNYAFAKEHNIPTDSGYSISPHHSGVYPAHEILYIAWKKIWNVKVTSTEEYPHLRPARLRRGFIHRDIMVLPRQTCGLFTHTMYIDRYPGGRDKLDESIQGGELFQTIVYNPINIFMTHMSNYGSDRLALYTFQSVIKFLQCWTNLKLSSAPPIQLAEMYFRLHPEEVDPVWGNPCDDPRHKKIWSKKKSCDSLPKFLVIGPQKTGTTALYTFLSMHSSITSNIPSPDTYEEIQFFNGNNYYRGLDWYMDFFPSDVSSNTTVATTTRYMFEKSATYFDGEAVPKRAHALLPHAKIVSILISPAKRAYSWYQHQRAHGDAIANNYSFYQVITASDSAPKALKDLRNRCLNPGKYAQHLEHWLAYYPAQQLHIIDGEQLRLNPVDVMNDLQRFLKIQPTLDYSNHLRFDAKKGFFCQVLSEKRNKCLGKSKGRQYPSMDERSAKLLQRYYLSHNTALVKLLKKLGSRPIPQWLKDDLSTGT